MNETSDGELMTLLAGGNQAAFQELYRRYGAIVLGYCRRLLKNPSLSEEASQEAWIRVVRAAASYRAEGSVKSWVLTVARRAAFNYVRDHNSSEEVPLESEDQVGTIQDFEDQVLARSEVAQVRQALEQLPDRQRLALVLWLTEDMSYEQIAQQLDVSESSVKSLLFRARQTLEAQLRGGQ
ncbi:MAG: RNA polymerase sigma factor [Bdellovibrionales bacterium]